MTGGKQLAACPDVLPTFGSSESRRVSAQALKPNISIFRARQSNCMWVIISAVLVALGQTEVLGNHVNLIRMQLSPLYHIRGTRVSAMCLLFTKGLYIVFQIH